MHRAVGPVQDNVKHFYSVLWPLRAIGTLSRNHSLNRWRQEQSVTRQEASKVSGQEMKTKKISNSARGGIATGKGLARRTWGSEFQGLGPTEQKDRPHTFFNLKFGTFKVGGSDERNVRGGT